MRTISCHICGNTVYIPDCLGNVAVEHYPYCHKIYATQQNTDKPPLGTKPCHIHAEQRIEDLSNAILRNIGSDKPKYDLIRKWATEIVLQCDIAEIIE